MGLGSYLFGEKPKVEQQSTLAPWQEQLTGPLNSTLNRQTPQYSGQLSAAPPSVYQTSLAGLENWAGQFGSMDFQQPIENIMAGKTAAGGESTWENAFKNYSDELTRSFVEKTLPQISRKQDLQGNYWGTDRSFQDDQAYQEFSKALNTTGGELAYKAHYADIDNALKAMGMTPAITAAYGDLLKGSTVELGRQQEDLNRQYQDWLRQTEEPKDMAKLMLGALGVPATALVQTGGTSGLFGSLMNMGGNIGSQWAGTESGGSSISNWLSSLFGGSSGAGSAAGAGSASAASWADWA